MVSNKIIGIALSGKAGAGKDTIADAIIEQLASQGVPAQKEKLAAPIYEEAVRIHKMDPSNKDRKLLQEIGDFHTLRDPSYFPRLLRERTRDASADGTVFVVTDLRKVIEAEYLRQCGFFIVRLNVSPEVQQERLLEMYGPGALDRLTHWTETDLDKYDRWDDEVWNNGLFSQEFVATNILKHFQYAQRVGR